MKQGNTRLARLLLRITGITTALMFLPVCCEASTVSSGIWAMMLLPLGFGLFTLVYATSQGYWFERRCERVWKETCCGLEGFKGTARSYKFGLVGAFILGDTKTIYPKLREVHGSHEVWTGIVTPFAGQTIEEYNEHTKAFALSFNVRFVSLERNKLIQGKSRKIVPSRAMPLNVIIIDELAYLSVMVPDKKLRDRAQTAIGTILVLGRATGYSLIACSQDPRKEVLGFRDYFPTKIALAMEAPMVDLVLGEGAHDIGMAHCEQIPLREAGAGCAYVKEEMGDGMLLVRAAWCSDEAIRMMMTKPQAFGVQVQSEPMPQYGQGYVPQLNWNGQPLPDLQNRVSE